MKAALTAGPRGTMIDNRQRGTRIIARSSLLIGATIGLMLTVTACAPDERPPIVTDVTWSDGAPSGDLVTTPAGEAVYAYELQRAAANNALDYTSDALAELRGPTGPGAWADTTRTAIAEGTFEAYLGPRPLVILSIEPAAGDSEQMDVTVCASSIPTDASPEPTDFEEWRYVVDLSGDAPSVPSVQTVASMGSDSTPVVCDPGPGLSRATFTPGPDLAFLDAATRDTVLAP